MPLETATYLNQLVATNPAATDTTGQGDDHLRLIKSALVASFPNIGGAANITHTQLNTLATALAAKQSMVPTGAMLPFANTFSDANWLRCNGGTFNYVDHPELGAFLGFVSGVCTLPNFEDTGRFVRSITTGLAVRTSQANQNGSHTHTGSVNVSGSASVTGTVSGTTLGQSADHGHLFSGTTSGQSADHSHSVTAGQYAGFNAQSGGGSNAMLNGTFNTGGTSNDHTHSFSGTTAGTSANHTHDFSWTGTLNGSSSGSGSFTTAASGGAEARPESYAAVWYIHV